MSAELARTDALAKSPIWQAAAITTLTIAKRHEEATTKRSRRPSPGDDPPIRPTQVFCGESAATASAH